MTDKPTVAVLGTGIMGAAMARNILKADFPVRVWNRTHAKAEPLAADGAAVAANPADAVRDADVVLTMLYDGPSVLDAMGDAAPALKRGAVWLQATTVGVNAFADVAAFAGVHGLVLFDAPVLGSRQPAEAGQLVILAAGPDEHRAAAEPLFAAVGARTIWTGEAGSATRLKLVANSWVLAVTHATGEALALAKGLGVDPAGFFAALDGGPLDLPYLRAKGDLILGGRLTPASFATDTAVKDARLIVEAAGRAGVRLDVAEAGVRRFERAVEAGHGADDMAATYYASF